MMLRMRVSLLVQLVTLTKACVCEYMEGGGEGGIHTLKGSF